MAYDYIVAQAVDRMTAELKRFNDREEKKQRANPVTNSHRPSPRSAG